MKSIEQVRQWVLGNSIHNDERDECCPDFSCCQPELLAPFKDRREFHLSMQAGNKKIMDKMLMTFLGRLIKENSNPGEVHLIGGNS